MGFNSAFKGLRKFKKINVNKNVYNKNDSKTKIRRENYRGGGNILPSPATAN